MKKQAVEYSIKAEKKEFAIAKITNSIDASEYARKFYFDDILIYESAFIMLMNRANNIVGYAKISQGGVSGTVVDVKIVAKYAIDTLASGVILLHNHPSGNKAPSTQDIQMASRLRKALELIDVKLLDSIILTEDDFYSLSDNGNL